ncbi:signal recognition particle subunit srp68 [Rhizina undulata]
MDITSFVTGLRQEALLLGDYNAYRAMCSRRLKTLRKQLGRSNSKSKKFVPETPLTPEDIARDPTHIRLYLYYTERAWAHAMHMKSLLADDNTNASGDMRTHLISRIHKAYIHSTRLCTLLSSAESNSTEKDVLEATAYAASLRGVEAFEKSHWDPAIRAFAVARIIYAVLLESTKNDLFKEQLTTTVDLSIRYSAYQLQLPRSMDIATISREYFPRDQEANVASILERLDSKVFSGETETRAAEAVTSVTWRGRTAPVEEADISAALGNAQAAETAYYAQEQEKAAEVFDDILSAWQDVVDATKKTIDERIAEGMGMGEQKMQYLQLTWTVVNYSLICWRIGRNRVMIQAIAQGGKKGRKGGEEVTGKKLGHLKEEVVLYDAIIQSIDQITELPGVAADEAFTAELSAKRSFFSALKCGSIARSHALLDNKKNALALYHRAYTYIQSSLPSLPTVASPASQKGLEITPAEVQTTAESLQGEVARYRALVEMDLISSKLSASAKAGKGVIVDRLGEYPAKEEIDFQDGIVQWPPKLACVPVKPLFLDVAWNLVEYPGGEDKKVVAAKQVEEKKQEERRKGFLGSLWGR